MLLLFRSCPTTTSSSWPSPPASLATSRAWSESRARNGEAMTRPNKPHRIDKKEQVSMTTRFIFFPFLNKMNVEDSKFLSVILVLKLLIIFILIDFWISSRIIFSPLHTFSFIYHTWVSLSRVTVNSWWILNVSIRLWSYR